MGPNRYRLLQPFELHFLLVPSLLLSPVVGARGYVVWVYSGIRILYTHKVVFSLLIIVS